MGLNLLLGYFEIRYSIRNKILVRLQDVYLDNGDIALICKVFCNSCIFSFNSTYLRCFLQYNPTSLQSLHFRYFV